MDHASLDLRFKEFLATSKAKPYQRQKSALERQLADFLASMRPPKRLTSCTSDDIIKFLISKDTAGRTLVHSQACSGNGCNCPVRLAAGSVDSLLGKLRSVFNNLGRLHDSNPVAHPRVKSYLRFVREEQASGAVTPSQAVPLYFTKFTKLIDFLRSSIQNGSQSSATVKYILVRDTAFFVTDFFTGDRASDLGRLLSNQVFRLKDRKGFLLKLTLTKTVRGDAARFIVLEPFCNKGVCPVEWLEYYIAACRLLGVDLTRGFFFRSTDRKKAVSENPFLGSAVNNRLRKYLSDAKIDGGETPHSFRVGLSNTLNMLGCSPEDISQCLGWRSKETVSHYTKASNIVNSTTLLEGRVHPGDTSLLDARPPSHPDNLEAIGH